MTWKQEKREFRLDLTPVGWCVVRESPSLRARGQAPWIVSIFGHQFPGKYFTDEAARAFAYAEAKRRLVVALEKIDAAP